MHTDWYYAENGSQVGPVTPELLKAAVSSGRLSQDTLVWHAGLSEWTAYSRAFPAHHTAHTPGPAPRAASFMGAPTTNEDPLSSVRGLGTWPFLGLIFATCGIYAFVWMFINTPKLESAGKKAIASNAFLVVLTALWVWSTALRSTGLLVLVLIGGLLVIAMLVMAAIWGLKSKDALIDYARNVFGFEYRMNAFYAVVLNYFYINYCINDIPKESARLGSYSRR